jgi:oligopeptide/dipeptide ABC transporter ATP-binding protein
VSAEPKAPEPQATVLELEDLRTEFVLSRGVVRAVRGISLTVRPGERLGIVGESGSGKSAMALSVMSLLPPPGRVVGGSIRFAGRELVGMSDRQMTEVRGKGISLIYQDASAALDPVRSIGSQVVEAIRQHEPMGRAAARRRAIELLLDVELPGAAHLLDDYPHHLSGGMRQRVIIACALAHRPPVVIADEPTTALDVTTQAQVIGLLSRLADEYGSAVILISHNLGVVAEFCDSVRVMYAGRFVEVAATEDIFNAPLHPYTAGLLNSIPQVSGSQRTPLPAIAGSPPDLASLGPGCAFEPRCTLALGRVRCLQEAPAARPLQNRTVECHYADEQVANV